MITSIAIQEIHDTLPNRNAQAIAAVHAGAFDTTDWQAMWRQRGVRLERLADELERVSGERDMLAKVAAALVHELFALKYPASNDVVDPIHAAIAAMHKR